MYRPVKTKPSRGIFRALFLFFVFVCLETGAGTERDYSQWDGDRSEWLALFERIYSGSTHPDRNHTDNSAAMQWPDSQSLPSRDLQWRITPRERITRHGP